ncbi:hypothetical protein GUITHDRAFT_112562 [Guillardia theta CCMP2712]|uniref:Uncharacterized protein n=1 Tax=Guillardia theta (strain CCMP2712) TaxID=905079 RepID=L1IYQ1_GUITC|nr:hypothetical protein GUITHDRAFT_112562 [Guillardia theta CCMP2712]EKX41351.1 hypothetical protein GUITHDRAFT_112562 [Guillardia theta CCMP2712]|eukprot:XP_005828331.1 hypothetical protein GUITHDRAFT_112562 [Guillardia theta CCMP2712]
MKEGWAGGGGGGGVMRAKLKKDTTELETGQYAHDGKDKDLRLVGRSTTNLNTKEAEILAFTFVYDASCSSSSYLLLLQLRDSLASVSYSLRRVSDAAESDEVFSSPSMHGHQARACILDGPLVVLQDRPSHLVVFHTQQVLRKGEVTVKWCVSEIDTSGAGASDMLAGFCLHGNLASPVAVLRTVEEEEEKRCRFQVLLVSFQGQVTRTVQLSGPPKELAVLEGWGEEGEHARLLCVVEDEDKSLVVIHELRVERVAEGVDGMVRVRARSQVEDVYLGLQMSEGEGMEEEMEETARVKWSGQDDAVGRSREDHKPRSELDGLEKVSTCLRAKQRNCTEDLLRLNEQKRRKRLAVSSQLDMRTSSLRSQSRGTGSSEQEVSVTWSRVPLARLEEDLGGAVKALEKELEMSVKTVEQLEGGGGGRGRESALQWINSQAELDERMYKLLMLAA